MTDVPKQFPYGGGPARYVNPRLAAARGVEVADLPGEAPVYIEPAFDEAVDDGSPVVVADPGADADDLFDLDFDAGFVGAPAHADRAAPEHVGISAAAHLQQDVFAYMGWECDCKATAKTGIPPRHYQQYDPALREAGTEWPYRIMVAPGRGEIKQGKGEGNVVEDDAEGAEKLPAVECPTWRRTVREWVRPERDWSKGKHGIKPPPAPEPEPVPVTHPAGPLGEPVPITVADLPPRCTAKALMLRADTAHQVSGRRVDDGPVVTRIRLHGRTESGAVWVAYWTEGKFDGARVNGVLFNLAELRAYLKG
jgi:hypothetical protein